MKQKFNQEHIIGIICIAIGAVVLVLTRTFPGGTDAVNISGPAFFPNVLSWILIILGLYEMLFGTFGKLDNIHSVSDIRAGMKTPEFLNLVIITAALIIYILTVEVIGFFTISFLFLYTILWRLGGRMVKNLISSLVILVVIYAIFTLIFAVSLPNGILF